MRPVVFTAALAVVSLFGSASAAVGQDGAEVAAPVAPPAGVSETSAMVGAGDLAVRARITMPRDASGVPGVVLVHGSGPGTLDMNVGGSTIYRDLAWGLAQRGVAVIRYEKRTTAHPDYFANRDRAVSLDEEYREDAAAAIRLLAADPRVDPQRLYVFGNSAGGVLAAGIANRLELAGAVIMSSSPRNVGDIIIDQADYVASISQDDPERLRVAAEVRSNGERIRALDANSDREEVIHGMPVWYWHDFAAADPIGEVERLTERGGRALIMHGGRDYLVVEEDWALWTAALTDRPGVELRVYPALNHIMQEGEGRMTPEEYRWTRPVSESWIADVATWLNAEISPDQGAARP